MPKLRDKYSLYETNNNPLVASTLLYGYLGNLVSEEKKLDILKKLSVINEHDGSYKESREALYGNKFEKLGQFVEEDSLSREDHSKNMPGHNLWVQKNVSKHYSDPIVDDALVMFDEGMRELNELVEEKEKELKFESPNAQNHFQILKGFMKDSYEGQLSKKIGENVSYGVADMLTAKVGFPTVNLSYNEKSKEIVLKRNGKDVDLVLKETADLGIVEAMAGGVRLTNQTKESIDTGNVSRQEVLHEIEQQTKRLDDLMQLKEESVEKLRKQGILQNTLDEFTAGDRGIWYAISDVKARKEAVEAGYPLEDLSIMSAFYIQTESYQRDLNRSQKELDRLNKDNANVLEGDPKYEGVQKQRQEFQKKIDDLNKCQKKMQETWKKVTDPKSGPLTEEKRLQNLREMKECLESMPVKGNSVVNGFSERVEERINAPLSAGDKTMLAGDYTAMYNALNETDPRTLFTSSKQFRAMKKAVKELADLEKSIPPQERAKNQDFMKKKREVLEKTQNYLRYKNREMNGPGSKHKRSEREKKRVQAADAVYNRILSDLQRQEPEIKLTDNEKQIIEETKTNDLLAPRSTGDPTTYAECIRQHTGVAAMSGTKEEMIDDTAKVLAAQMLSKQNPPKAFDLKTVEKAAEQIKTKFNLNNATEDDLRNALQRPETVRRLAQRHHRESYRLPPNQYEDYVKDMRRLYRRMEEPDGTDKNYQKVFENVKKIAHLPDNYEEMGEIGLSEEKVEQLVETANSNILEATDRYLERNAKTVGPNDSKMLHSMRIMKDYLPMIGQERIQNMQDAIHEKRGVKNIDEKDYVELEDYGVNKEARYGLKKSDTKRECSIQVAKELYANLKTIDAERAKLKQIKGQDMEKPRAKEAEDAKKKTKNVEQKKKPSVGGMVV